MIFDGMSFKESNTLVRIPSDSNYIIFGRICAKGTKGAIKTGYTYANNVKTAKLVAVEGDPVYAKKLPITGYSLTNMAYGKPAYRNRCNGTWQEWLQPVYLMKGGRMYSTRYLTDKSVYDRGRKVAYIPTTENPERKPRCQTKS